MTRWVISALVVCLVLASAVEVADKAKNAVHFAQRLLKPVGGVATDSTAFGVLRLDKANMTADVTLHWNTTSSVKAASINCPGGPKDVANASITICTSIATCVSPMHLFNAAVTQDTWEFLVSNNCYWTISTETRDNEIRAQLDGFAPGAVAGYQPPAGKNTWLNNFWVADVTPQQAVNDTQTAPSTDYTKSALFYVTKSVAGADEVYSLSGINNIENVTKVTIHQAADPGTDAPAVYTICDGNCPTTKNWELASFATVNTASPLSLVGKAYIRVEADDAYVARGQLHLPVNLLTPKFDEAYPPTANFRFSPANTASQGAHGVGVAWIMPGVTRTEVRAAVYHTVEGATRLTLKAGDETITLCDTVATCASPIIKTELLAQTTTNIANLAHFDALMVGVGVLTLTNGTHTLTATVNPRANYAKYATQCTNDQAMVWLNKRGLKPTGGIFLISRNETVGTSDATIHIFGLHNVPSLQKFHLHTGAGVYQTNAKDKPVNPCATVAACAAKFPVAGVIDHSQVLNASDWALVDAGLTYINVHSDRYEDGEAHGQVSAMVGFSEAAEAHFALKFVANPGAVTSSVAYGLVRLYTVKGQLYATTSIYHNITDVTGIHFHAPGTYPTTVADKIPLCSDSLECKTGDYFSKSTDKLVQRYADYFRQGTVYVQIHSSQYSDGELRAQCNAKAQPAMWAAELTNRQAASLSLGAVPAKPSGGIFLINRVQNATTKVDHLIVEGLHNIVSPTKMHIHGPAEVSHGTSAHLYPDMADDMCSNSPVIPGVPACVAGTRFYRDIPDTVLAIKQHVDAGRSFLNIHSAVLPSGESAGQIVSLRPAAPTLSGASGLSASLSLAVALAAAVLALLF